MEWKVIKDGKPVDNEKTEELEDVVEETPAEEIIEEAPETTDALQLEDLIAEEPVEPVDEQPVEKVVEEASTDEIINEAPETADALQLEDLIAEEPVEPVDEASELTADEKRLVRKQKRNKRFRIYRKTSFYVMLLCALALIAIFFFGVGIKNTDGPVGYWRITEASSGDVVMTTDDAKAMGLREIGSFKLNRGGDCVITYLGKSANGKWKEGKNGKIAIKYGNDKKIVGVINEETKVMTAKDTEAMVYKLEK